MTPPEPQCGICGLIDRIRAGKVRDFIAELDHSYVVLGDAQLYRGYCVLLAKHHTREMFMLSRSDALALAAELFSVAEAIYTVVKPLKLNYECLGNSEPHVHWHVFPRDQSEDQKPRRAPVWERPAAERMVPLEEHDRRALIAAIGSAIKRLIPGARIARD